jgi:hypothetical protein
MRLSSDKLNMQILVVRVVFLGCLIAFFVSCQAKAGEVDSKKPEVKTESAETEVANELIFTDLKKKNEKEECQHFCKVELPKQ